MIRLLPVILLLTILFLAAGCDDWERSPVQPSEPSAETAPLRIEPDTIYVPADAWEVDAYVYNLTDEPLGPRVRSSYPWMIPMQPFANVEPSGAQRLDLYITRYGLDPGVHAGEIEVQLGNETTISAPVVIQVGTPDKSPIGLSSNLVLIGLLDDDLTLEVYNNSAEMWPSPAQWPGRIEVPGGRVHSVTHNERPLAPGEHATLTIDLSLPAPSGNDFDYEDVYLYWGDKRVQTIRVGIYRPHYWW